MTAPVIEAADCTASGNNTATSSWAVSHPVAATGDLLIFNLAWDDSTNTTSVSAPTGPNGETLTSLTSGPYASLTDKVRGEVWYTKATGSWAASTVTFTPNAAESWSATVIRIPAGEFDSTAPLGEYSTRTASSDPEATAYCPIFSAGASDGGSTLVWFAFVDTQAISATNPTGWTIRQRQDIGAVAHGISTRDAATTNNESISDANGWALTVSDVWASIAYIVRAAPTTTKYLKLLAESAAASQTGLEVVVHSAPAGTNYVTGTTRYGSTSGQEFEAALEAGEAVLLVLASDVGCSALAASTAVAALAQNTTYTTGMVAATIIEV